MWVTYGGNLEAVEAVETWKFAVIGRIVEWTMFPHSGDLAPGLWCDRPTGEQEKYSACNLTTPRVPTSQRSCIVGGPGCGRGAAPRPRKDLGQRDKYPIAVPGVQ